MTLGDNAVETTKPYTAEEIQAKAQDSDLISCEEEDRMLAAVLVRDEEIARLNRERTPECLRALARVAQLEVALRSIASGDGVNSGADAVLVAEAALRGTP